MTNRINFERTYENGNKGTAYIVTPDSMRKTYRVFINDGRNIKYGEYKTLRGAKNALLKIAAYEEI